jgi:hypothetical protein
MQDDLQHMQAALLLYLAGELPPDERAEVEQRLAQDQLLRQSFEELRSLNDGLTLMLKESDAIAIPAAARESRRGTAVRQISRAMVRRQLQEKSSESVAPLQIKRWWLRTWAFPIAAALAIVALGIFYLSNNIASRNLPGDRPLLTQSNSPTTSDSDPNAVVALSDSQRTLDNDVEEGDRNVLSISPSAYDVSSMFEAQTN